jgi:hypothetical protein
MLQFESWKTLTTFRAPRADAELQGQRTGSGVRDLCGYAQLIGPEYYSARVQSLLILL